MTKKAMIEGTGKLNANKKIGDGPDCREHGTKWKTGARGVLTPDVVRELAGYGMTVPAIGYYLGCSKQNIYDAIADDEELNQAWCEGIAQLLYKAGKNISSKIESGDSLLSMFTVKCKRLPGEEGWVEQQYRKDAPDNNQHTVHIYLPSNGRDEPPEESITFSDSNG